MAKQQWFAVWASGLALAACTGDLQGEDKEGSEAAAVTATTQTQSFGAALNSGVENLGGFNVDGIEPATLTVFHLHVEGTAKWQATVVSDVTWDSDKVRQGQNLAVSREATASIGLIKVAWTITGVLRPLDLFDVDIGTIVLPLDVTACSPNLDAGAGAYSCLATSPGVPLVFTPGIPLSPYVDLAVDIKFTVTPNGGVVTRGFFIGDFEAVPQSDLSLTPSAETETIAMPCSRPAGDEVQYVLDPVRWSPADTTSRQQPAFVIGLMDPVFGAFKLPALFNAPFGPGINGSPNFALEGGGESIDLGPLLANNVPPTIAPIGPFGGQEGNPVQFQANVTSQCPVTSMVWSFSNGTQSFGPTPQRTFGDDGVFNGELKVTDMTNLSATGDFTVSITNRPPVAVAGPDTSGPWNRPIEFHGQAVDPGADDQATLTYTWDFGDGTPGAGGADVTHNYALPGNYVAKLVVCDDHTCVADTTNVHVRRRTTMVAYTGANTAQFSATATLGGSIVDEFGQPVVGGAVSFNLAGNPAGSALTDATGNAARVNDITLVAGIYAVSATFPGSALYDGAAAASQFTVTHMPSTVQYTGAIQGGPNKTVALSAKLIDSLGRPLDGKTIVFTLGTQTVSATTGAGGVAGVATTTLKLDQKNGTYSLTAAWAPTAGDVAKFTGATTSVTFTIGNKLVTPGTTTSYPYTGGLGMYR